MILFEADEVGADLLSGASFECDGASVPIWVWAPGGDDFAPPRNVGFDLPRFGVLQIHYNNPNGIQGLVDHSGVMLEITPTRRQ